MNIAGEAGGGLLNAMPDAVLVVDRNGCKAVVTQTVSTGLDVIDAKDQGIKANDVHGYHSIEIKIRRPRRPTRKARRRRWEPGGGVGKKPDCGED